MQITVVSRPIVNNCFGLHTGKLDLERYFRIIFRQESVQRQKIAIRTGAFERHGRVKTDKQGSGAYEIDKPTEK